MQHALPVWELAKSAALGPVEHAAAGLSSTEAAERLGEFGPNEFPPPPRPRLVLRFFNQLTHFMALLLWIAGVLAFVAGTPLIGVAIWAVVLINAVFSFAQEYRAERALTALTKLLPLQAKVYRNSVLTVVSARELVVGDVIELEAGDKVPVDAHLIASEGLLVEMSAITGESMPVVREPPTRQLPLGEHPVSSRTPHRVGDNPSIVLAGTTVLSGTARALAFATGLRTEFGHLAQLATAAEKAPNRLQVETTHIVHVITVLACTMGASVFLIAYGVMGLHAVDSLLLGIGILVANVPEGLLPTVSVALALGVQRMARSNALVRKLSAIEGLSAVTVLCTDKTGTLTLNSMAVHLVWTPDDGATPLREVTESTSEPLPPTTPAARTLLAAAALCSHRSAPRESTQSSPIGDPTETAIIDAAAANGDTIADLLSSAAITREFSFDSRRRLMSVVVELAATPSKPPPLAGLPNSGPLLITKGAPDALIARASHLLEHDTLIELDGDRRNHLTITYDTIAQKGFRVLAVGVRAVTESDDSSHRDALEQDLTLLGYIALFDPIRPEVPDAIATCRTAGIAICMITGDYGATAQAIGDLIGMQGIEGTPITGDQVAAMTDGQLRNVLHARPGGIFARMDPDQKLRLVRTLRDLGHVVAVTGDGVNDAPALKAAHVGFAMGKRGTDVAREVADVVLLDDNFATIVCAIEQGRSTFDNIRKFLTYLLASNIPELAPFLCMAALGIPPALTIIQILLVDLGTDLAPAVALGREPPADDVMKRPPICAGERLLSWPLIGRAYGLLGVAESLAAMGAFFLVWFSSGLSLEQMQNSTHAILRGSASPEITRVYATSTAATFLTVIACQMGNVFACRSDKRPVWRQHRPANWLLWVGLSIEVVILVAIGRYPPAQQLFGNESLPSAVWYWLIASPFCLVCFDGTAKRIARLRREPQSC